jgi:polar amino acid transport system permease protein
MTPSASRPDRPFPYWLAAAVVLAVAGAVFIAADEIYNQIARTIAQGIGITVMVTLVAFALASALGLLIAVAGRSRSVIAREVSRFYIEIIRGVPMLVLLFYIAFVGAPALVALLNVMTTPLRDAGLVGPMVTRDFPLIWRAVLALTIGYSAFLAEIFRAGIQSVDRGQLEASRALGLNRWQVFRLIVMPQAIRTVLPPLGNDLVAMVKDSSLVSVLGVTDITQMGKVYAASSFRFFETYNVVAFIYLLMTVSLSLAVRGLEQRLRRSERAD